MAEAARHRIFVVEDDVATRRLLQRQLERAGYPVEAFEDARTALDRIREAGASIVLADWSMPGMDGLELCRTLRELEQLHALGNNYILLVTAHGGKDHVVQGLEAGANDYLIKPYHAGELLARIRVGDRILQLQEDLLKRTMELHKANAQMALLAGKLEGLANTDALTGLGNRRRLFGCLNDAWEVSASSGEPLSAVMLDIDRFKGVNDSHGHAAGDQVLRHVADVIRRQSHRPDHCGRFGGEEFLLICAAQTVEQAGLLSEQIRLEIARDSAVYQGTAIPISLSGGVAGKDARTASPDGLVRAADAMLYAAKQHGRNQTWALGGDGRARRVVVPPDAANGAPQAPAVIAGSAGARSHPSTR